MAKFFQFWFGLCLLSLTIYIPAFFIINSSDDLVEEVTLKEILPSLSYAGFTEQMVRRQIFQLKKLKIDTDRELIDALEDMEDVSNIDVEIIQTKQERIRSSDRALTDVDIVRLSFEDAESTIYLLDFVVIDKSFLNFGHSELVGLMKIEDSKRGRYNDRHIFELFGRIFSENNSNLVNFK